MRGLFLDNFYKLDCENKINYFDILYNGKTIETEYSIGVDEVSGTIDDNGYLSNSGKVILTRLDNTNNDNFIKDNGEYVYYSKMITSKIKKTVIHQSLNDN